MKLKVSRSSEKMLMEEGGEDVAEEPVSPPAQYLNSSVLCVSILAVFELEIPIDDYPAIWELENVFLPINPRFSSVMVNMVPLKFIDTNACSIRSF